MFDNYRRFIAAWSRSDLGEGYAIRYGSIDSNGSTTRRSSARDPGCRASTCTQDNTRTHRVCLCSTNLMQTRWYPLLCLFSGKHNAHMTHICWRSMKIFFVHRKTLFWLCTAAVQEIAVPEKSPSSGLNPSAPSFKQGKGQCSRGPLLYAPKTELSYNYKLIDKHIPTNY